MAEPIRFKKALATYYHRWFRDCFDSAVYCRANGHNQLAEKYVSDAHRYFNLIQDNWNAIEFFSIGDNAFKLDRFLPKEFQGYE